MLRKDRGKIVASFIFLIDIYNNVGYMTCTFNKQCCNGFNETLQIIIIEFIRLMYYAHAHILEEALRFRMFKYRLTIDICAVSLDCFNIA